MKKPLGLVGLCLLGWMLLGGNVQQAIYSVAVGNITGLGTGISTFLGTTYVATTWTPTVTTDATVGTPVYSVQVGSYEQIGRQVTVRFFVALSSWGGAPTGNAQIGGLPVAAGNVTNDRGQCAISNWGTASSYVFVGADIIANTSVIRVVGITAAATSIPLISAVGAGTTFTLTGKCVYHT